MKKNNNIDSLFKEGFQDFAPTPDAKVWQAVAQKVKQKKKRIVVFWATGIAASILLLLTLAIPQFFPAKNNQLETTIVAKTNKQNNTITHKAIANNNATNQNLNKKSEKIDNNTNKKLIAKTETNKKNKNSISTKLQQSKITKITTLQLQNGIYIALQSNEQPSTQLIYDNKNLLEQNLITYNIMKQEVSSSNISQKKWSIIGQIATAYTSEKSANTSGMVNIGGGMKVNFKMGKKLALQTGIAFSRYGQSYQKGNNSLMSSIVTSEITNSTDPATKNNSTIPDVTPAGRIISSQKQQNSITDKAEFAATNLFYNPQRDIEQSFDYIEVPLLLRYNILERKIGFFIQGGVGVNWLIANAVYTTNNHEKIGEIANLNRTNLSSQVGIGIEYKLSSKLKIGVEPTFKYYINSLNGDKAYNYRPYSIGVQTGIRFDL